MNGDIAEFISDHMSSMSSTPDPSDFGFQEEDEEEPGDKMCDDPFFYQQVDAK